MLLFITVIVAFIIYFSPFYFKKSHSKASIQSIVTSIGILGTFIGIVWGLYLLDFTDLELSIPNLLNGLYISFFTSIAGLAAAVTVKVFPNFYKLKEEQDKDDGLESMLGEVITEIKAVNKNLSGDEDTTLLTQLQKLRVSIVDKQEELNKSFKDFAEKMIEDNSQSLINALTDVMKDFNAKINEQFGDNFKQLNEGIGKMLEWQENYKNQVEINTQALNASKESLEETVVSMSIAVKQHEDFAKVTEDLNLKLETMGVFISSINALSESLEGSGDNIKKEIESITQKSLSQLGEGLVSISEKLVQDYKGLQETISQISNETK